MKITTFGDMGKQRAPHISDALFQNPGSPTDANEVHPVGKA